jgi:hypothetical protein
MRARYAVLFTLVISCLLMSSTAPGEDSDLSSRTEKSASATAPDPLLQLLVSKGVLNADEARTLTGTPAEQRARLLDLLKQKVAHDAVCLGAGGSQPDRLDHAHLAGGPGESRT